MERELQSLLQDYIDQVTAHNKDVFEHNAKIDEDFKKRAETDPDAEYKGAKREVQVSLYGLLEWLRNGKSL